MKVNDFPASPSNQYSLYKLNAPVERSFGQPYQQIPVAPASDISHLKHSSIIEKSGLIFISKTSDCLTIGVQKDPPILYCTNSTLNCFSYVRLTFAILIN